MKIYHISDTTGFFGKLSSCKGNVEIVSPDGMHVSLKETDDRDNLRRLAQTYASGIIKRYKNTRIQPEEFR